MAGAKWDVLDALHDVLSLLEFRFHKNDVLLDRMIFSVHRDPDLPGSTEE